MYGFEALWFNIKDGYLGMHSEQIISRKHYLFAHVDHTSCVRLVIPLFTPYFPYEAHQRN